MREAIRTGLLALLLPLALQLPAGAAPAVDEVPRGSGTFVAKEFRFASGEVLSALSLRYTTLGTKRTDPAGRAVNVVLLLHGTGGSGAQFLQPPFEGVLFGPGQPLDASRFFIVMPDGIGHGGSSKPSDGPKGKFPRYGYGDMVRAQHLLLTEGLGVNHLRLVLGTSMGGMHAWLWGETYPDFADALMPLASLPAPIAGRNRMWRKLSIDLIRGDPGWQGGSYARQPEGLKGVLSVMLLVSGSPHQWLRQAPTSAAADAFATKYVQDRFASIDANDLLWALEASGDYDPSGSLEKITAPLFALNFADDAINPPELGLLEQGVARVKQGRGLVLPLSPETKGHQTHSWPALWKEHLVDLMGQSERAPAK